MYMQRGVEIDRYIVCRCIKSICSVQSCDKRYPYANRC